MNDSCPCYYVLCFPKCTTWKGKICTVKVILYWFQGKTVVHIWCSRVWRYQRKQKYLYTTHLDHRSQWLLERINIQLKFNYVPQVKKNYDFFFLLQDICFRLAEKSYSSPDPLGPARTDRLGCAGHGRTEEMVSPANNFHTVRKSGEEQSGNVQTTAI